MLTKVDKNNLIGRWALISHKYTNGSGNITEMGKSSSGMLIYGEDYSLSALITKISNPEHINEIIAYSGSYSIEKGEEDNLTLVHNIEMSLNEDRKGTFEKRIACIKNNVLTLKTDKNKNGFYEIVWKKL